MTVAQCEPQDQRPAQAVPVSWVVSREFGEMSQAWMWRQVVGMTRLRPRVICWRHVNASVFDVGDVPVWTIAGDETQTAVAKWLGRARNLRTRNFYAGGPLEQRALSQLATRQRPDVILCHFGHCALRLLPLAMRLRIPLVAHFHGIDLSAGLRNRWYRWSLLRHLRHLAAVVAVGSHQCRWLIEQGVAPERTHLIPCGVPTGQFVPPANRPAHPGARFISVSRLVPCKGVDQSLRAFAKVRAAVSAATLTIVGDGPQRDALESLSRALGVESAVFFRGALPPEQVKAELRNADVFLQHSLSTADGALEGFGVSIAEASAMELPVVVTNVGGIRDQVIDNVTGLLIEENDVDGMAQAMLALIGNAARRWALGAAGRARLIEHFDTAGQVAKLEQVLLAASRA